MDHTQARTLLAASEPGSSGCYRPRPANRRRIEPLLEEDCRRHPSRHPRDCPPARLGEAFAVEQLDRPVLDRSGIQYQLPIAQLASAALQVTEDGSPEPLALELRVHPYAFDLCDLHGASSQGTHGDNLPVDGSNHELAPAGRVGRLDLAQVVIPGTIAGVNSHLAQPEIMQRPDRLTVGRRVLP
jgi:hypothetical protein